MCKDLTPNVVEVRKRPDFALLYRILGLIHIYIK
jgi:hypothetical protein